MLFKLRLFKISFHLLICLGNFYVASISIKKQKKSRPNILFTLDTVHGNAIIHIFLFEDE